MTSNQLEQIHFEFFTVPTKNSETNTIRKTSQETCCSDLDKNLKKSKMSTGTGSRRNSLTESNSNSSFDIIGTDKDSSSDKEMSSFDSKFLTKKNENLLKNENYIFGENILRKKYSKNIRGIGGKNKNFVLKSEIINGFIYADNSDCNNINNNSIYGYLKNNIDYYYNEYYSFSKINNLNNVKNVQNDFFNINSNDSINLIDYNTLLLLKKLNPNQNKQSNTNFSAQQLFIEKNIKELNIFNKKNIGLSQNKFIENNNKELNAFSEIQKYIENKNNEPIDINKYDYTVLKNENLAKIAVYLIIDKKGCKFLQEKIQNNNHFVNNILFKYIQPYLVELSCDQYGNYFLQMLVNELNIFNLSLFIDSILNDIIQLCLSRYGSRVIQSIIDKVYKNNFLMNELIIYIFNKNDKNVNSNNNIFFSRHGNFVIQKLLNKIHLNENETIDIIYQYIYNNFLAITNSKYGVCIAQTIYKEANEFYRSKLYQLVIKNFNEIIFNEFGCFLLKSILTNNNSNKEIITKIQKNFESYFLNKNSSSVIEYCFEKDEKIRQYFLKFLVYEKPIYIIKMLINQNGNYIIQKALCLEDSVLKFEMMKVIMKNKEYLKNNGFGKKIFKKLLKNYFQNKNNFTSDNKE